MRMKYNIILSSSFAMTADLTALVDLLKDWMSLHQQSMAQGLPAPVFSRDSVQPVRNDPKPKHVLLCHGHESLTR